MFKHDDNQITNAPAGTNLSKNISTNTTNTSTSQDLNQYNYPPETYESKPYKMTEEEKVLESVKGRWWYDGNGGKTQNVRIGKPYKDTSGNWLVPAFDKKTGKFLSAVWVSPDGKRFFGEISSYMYYKLVVSGKEPMKRSNHSKAEIPNNSKSPILTKADANETNITSIPNNPLESLFEISQDFNLNQKHNIEANNETTEVPIKGAK